MSVLGNRHKHNVECGHDQKEDECPKHIWDRLVAPRGHIVGRESLALRDKEIHARDTRRVILASAKAIEKHCISRILFQKKITASQQLLQIFVFLSSGKH